MHLEVQPKQFQILSIILINEDKELVVGSLNSFYLLDSQTLKTIKKFQLTGWSVTGLS